MLVSVERLCFQIVPCLVVGAASCRDSLLSRQPTFAAGCQMQRDYGPQRRGHMSLKELEVEIRPVGFSAMDSTRDSFQSISATSSRKSKDMKQADYPKGWDEDRVKRVLAHYDNLSSVKCLPGGRGLRKAGRKNNVFIADYREEHRIGRISGV